MQEHKMMTLSHPEMRTLVETNIPNQTHHSVTGNSHKAQLPLRNELEYNSVADAISATTIVDFQRSLFSIIVFVYSGNKSMPNIARAASNAIAPMHPTLSCAFSLDPLTFASCKNIHDNNATTHNMMKAIPIVINQNNTIFLRHLLYT